jgi:hypothetical protein
MSRNIIGLDVEFLVKVENKRLSKKLFVKRLAVGVALIFKGLHGLPSDGIGRHKPEDKGVILFAYCFGDYLDRMGGHDGFAAPRGDFEAYAGYVRYAVPDGIAVFERDKAGRDFRLGGDLPEGFRVAYDAALREKAVQDIQGFSLVFF